MSIHRHHSDAKRAQAPVATRAQEQGYSAFELGTPLADNPYRRGSDEFYQWNTGWNEAEAYYDDEDQAA